MKDTELVFQRLVIMSLSGRLDKDYRECLGILHKDITRHIQESDAPALVGIMNTLGGLPPLDYANICVRCEPVIDTIAQLN